VISIDFFFFFFFFFCFLEPTVSWRRPRRRAKGTFELPYEKYCQRKNVSMVRQATSLPREFFIEFLVLFEMGQQR
jgi:hypothetical protein